MHRFVMLDVGCFLCFDALPKQGPTQDPTQDPLHKPFLFFLSSLSLLLICFNLFSFCFILFCFVLFHFISFIYLLGFFC